MFNASTQEVHVTSRPLAASVSADGEYVGNAPLTLRVSTNERHEISVSHGIQSKVYWLDPTLSPAGAAGMVGDVLILVPMSVFAGISFGASQIPGLEPIPLLVVAVGSATIGLAPLVIDGAIDNVYELRPGQLDAAFE